MTSERSHDAWDEAAEAASRAGVRIVAADSNARSHQAAELVARIWGGAGSADLAEPGLLRALEHAGNYVVLALDEGERPVGVCVAFFSSPPLAHLHSHIAGVASPAVGRGVGVAMKLHQRAWTLERGVTRVRWTFDPLIRRNAHFNLRKLGAAVTEYLPDFYGRMSDARNAGHGSDRFLVQWALDVVPTGALGHLELPEWVALRGEREPVFVQPPEPGSSGTVALPPDMEALRREAPDLARTWRELTGRVFEATIAAGTHRITGVDDAGRYRLEPLP